MEPGWIETERCAACGSRAWRNAGSACGVGIRRCRDCATLRFAAVAPPEAVYRDGYHSGAAPLGWDWTRPEVQAYELALAEARLEWIERARPGRGRMADVGGGLGFLARAAAGRGWDAELVEPVAAAVEHARAAFALRARRGGIEDLAEGGPYDLVVLSHVLEHLLDAVGALRSVRASLAPGGVAYVEVPNHASLARRMLGDAWGGWQPGQHVSLFTPRTLRALAARAGYAVVAAGTFVPLWGGLPAGACAHFLGIERLLNAAVGLRRRLVRQPGSPTQEALRDDALAARATVPLADATGAAHAVLRRTVGPLAAAESALGLGTNARVLLKPDENG